MSATVVLLPMIYQGMLLPRVIDGKNEIASLLHNNIIGNVFLIMLFASYSTTTTTTAMICDEYEYFFSLQGYAI